MTDFITACKAVQEGKKVYRTEEDIKLELFDDDGMVSIWYGEDDAVPCFDDVLAKDWVIEEVKKSDHTGVHTCDGSCLKFPIKNDEVKE